MASGFPGLSLELTQEIMKYLFGYMHTIHVQHGIDTEYTLGSIVEGYDDPDVEKLHPSILRVSSELRASGIEVLYGCHRFEFMDVTPLQWFVTNADTSQIRHLRFLLDKDETEIMAWVAYWDTNEFKTAFPKLQSIEVDSLFAPLTGEYKRWVDIRLNVACELLQKAVGSRCTVVKKYKPIQEIQTTTS